MSRTRSENPRVLIAPSAFKESLSPREAAEAMRRGWQRGFPGCAFVVCSLADGGDGTLETLVPNRRNWIEERVSGPRCKTLRTFWGRRDRGRTAVVEMARASGLALLPPGERR
ncbi:MAG: glycerate kinase, partial [bacterium]